MAIPPFTSGYPPDGSSLGNTKSTIRNNLDGTFLAFSVDHQDQNETGTGSHTKVSLKETTGSTTPTLPPNIFGLGYETLYSQPAGSAPLGPLGEVFYSRGGNAGIQLTGPGTPVATTNGSSFIAGGILLNWGQATHVTDGIVTFTQNYSSSPFAILITVFENNNNRHFVTVKTKSTSDFTVSSRDSGGNDESNTFFWLAIGV